MADTDYCPQFRVQVNVYPKIKQTMHTYTRNCVSVSCRTVYFSGSCTFNSIWRSLRPPESVPSGALSPDDPLQGSMLFCCAFQDGEKQIGMTSFFSKLLRGFAASSSPFCMIPGEQIQICAQGCRLQSHFKYEMHNSERRSMSRRTAKKRLAWRSFF